MGAHVMLSAMRQLISLVFVALVVACDPAEGVGSGTVVDHVQVHMSKDDGVEFWRNFFREPSERCGKKARLLQTRFRRFVNFIIGTSHRMSVFLKSKGQVVHDCTPDGNEMYPHVVFL